MRGTPTIVAHEYQFEELAMTDNEIAARPHSSRLGFWKTKEDDDSQDEDRESFLPHSRADNLKRKDAGICWFNPPDEAWSPSFYLSDRGLDNLHIYFWIVKDFCWVQSLLYPGMIIGSMACLYAVFLCFRAAVWRKNIGLFWIKFAEFLWLFANYWWMVSHIHSL